MMLLARLRAKAPNRQSNRPRPRQKTIKLGNSPKDRKQSQARPENNQKGPSNNQKLSKTIPKASKTIKNDTGAAFGGAPGALRAPGMVIFDCFGTFSDCFGPFSDCLGALFDCFRARPGIVFRPWAWRPKLIVFRPCLGLFDCIWGLPEADLGRFD